MSTTKYIWDVISDNVIHETDTNNSITSTYTSRPTHFGSAVSQKQAQTAYYYYDAQGSTRHLADTAEQITDSYVFTAFGVPISESEITKNPFKYHGSTGYFTDAETGDIYVRMRTYEPNNGRWLSSDPLGFIDGPNTYLPYFVPNSSDPEGLDVRVGKDEQGRTIWWGGKTGGGKNAKNCYVRVHGAPEWVKCPKIPGKEYGLDKFDKKIKSGWQAMKFIESLEGHNVSGLDSDIFLKQQVFNTISTLKAFADDKSPCAAWFREALRILTAAANGDCSECSKLQVRLRAPKSSFAVECYILIKNKTNTYVQAEQFRAFSIYIADKCASAPSCVSGCDKNGPELIPPIVGDSQ